MVKLFEFDTCKVLGEVAGDGTEFFCKLLHKLGIQVPTGGSGEGEGVQIPMVEQNAKWNPKTKVASVVVDFTWEKEKTTITVSHGPITQPTPQP